MHKVTQIIILAITASILFTPVVSAEDTAGQITVTAVFSEVIFSPDVFVSAIGYTVNGESGVDRLIVSAGDHIEVKLNYLPPGSSLKTTLGMGGLTHELTGYPLRLTVAPHNTASSITVYLELVGYSPTPTPTPTPTPSPGGGGSDPDPYIPVVPVVTPTVTPTPTVAPTETPGSDEPYTPILPPAGSVHSIAGLIPLAAGILLLFLVFFWKRKVYRILKHHAKQHGEKPDKDQLKATADAVIRVIRSDEYAGWRTDSVLTARLSAEIVRILDEMQYPSVVPREPVVAEILKSAKSKINRHRL